MIDLDLIRETYERLPLEKLLLVAKKDHKDLTPEAFELLEKEFRKRGLDLNEYLKPEVVELPEPPGDFIINKSGADDAMLGRSYQDLMYPEDPELGKARMEEEKANLNKLSSQQLEGMISRSHFSMFLYLLLFFLGITVTLVSFLVSGEDGRFIVAFGAVIGGGVGFFASYARKQKLKSHLTDFEFEKTPNSEL